MLELIKIILFGKLVVLTPDYIDILPGHPYIYEGKLSLLNKEASVEMDITKSNLRRVLGITDAKEIIRHNIDIKINNYLSECPIEIYGKNMQTRSKVLFDSPFISFASDNDIRLVFPIKHSSSDNINILHQIYIGSRCPIKHIKIFWKNYSK